MNISLHNAEVLPRRIEGIGANAFGRLTLAPKGNRLVYSTVYVNYDIYRLDLRTPDAKAQRFLASTRYDGSPAYSPDGKRIAFVSSRSGSREIWVADADGSNPAPLTSFAEGTAESPKWSPDGQFIVFDDNPARNRDVYIVPLTGGPVKRLTNDAGLDQSAAWSADGKWIYFQTSRTGRGEVFRMRPDGSAVQQITHEGGVDPDISPDGKWLYYVIPNNGLWRMPADGGEAMQIVPGRGPGLYFGFSSEGVITWQRREPAGYQLVVHPFAGGKTRVLAPVDRYGYHVAPSPDGHWLLFTSADDPVHEIMLVDNFR